MWTGRSEPSLRTITLAHPRTSIRPYLDNAESTEIRWWPTGDIDQLPLHRGLAGAWPRLRHPPAPLVVIVDSANVVGARPDGWWRDRLGATRRLLDQLGVLARAGIPAQSLPRGVSPGGLDGMLPGIALVVEGAARPLAQELTQTQTQTQTDDERWWDAAVTVLAAPRDGDTSIVDAANESATAGRQTVVVSADRGLRQRLDDGVHVAGPSWLLEQVTASDLHA